LTAPSVAARIAWLALRALPPELLNPMLTAAVAVSRRRHPGLFERLEPLGDVAFLIDPVDLPYRIVLRPAGPAPRLFAVRAGAATGHPSATIRGPLAVLVELLEGRLDGDALFFSRDLEIEGDTAAVVTLRNAVESAEIDLLSDVLAPLGPLAPPARRAAELAGALARRAVTDLGAARSALLGPALEPAADHAARLNALEAEVAALRRRPDGEGRRAPARRSASP